MTRKAAKQVYKKAGITPNDIQVIELHDCFSANEVCYNYYWIYWILFINVILWTKYFPKYFQIIFS